ncbi:SDR family NAD(P)-dependent oxidoreductase [Luteococcus sp. Sow4_B9]|uniref:SDR family NAD(P)-dependent oxidoreductase n=1 Tax=Luteococcus sp. Sow4_B9 TaxID=3438792 RepID=UPI003F95D231
MVPTNAPSGRPVALVAGASRGLGLLVATELGRRGHDLAICSRDEQSLERAAAQLTAQVPGVTVLTQVCDVANQAQVATFVERTEAQLGSVEVAIHVAGIIQVGPWQATRHEHFEQAIDVMLWGPINLSLAVIPRMTQRGHGRFGVVTSIGGKISPPRLLPYSVAKYGAVGLTEGLSAELAGTGVTATTIVPGLMRTGSHTQASFFGDARRQYAWFAPAASLPLLSMDATRAASRMVDAVLAGKPIALISPLSQMASRVHGLAPEVTLRAMGLAGRFLPRGDSPEVVPGEQARSRLGSRVVNTLTTLGDRAGRRTNEHP